MTKRRTDGDPAKRIRPGVVSTLPDNHIPTVYARAKVCARCGQDWPCQSALLGTGVDVSWEMVG